MHSSFINYHIGHFFKQLEYRYITFKNNKAVGRHFVYSSRIRPVARTIAFTKDHSLFMTLFASGLILMSLMVLLKPVNFSKPTLLRLEIDKKIQKKLVNLSPVTIRPLSLSPVSTAPVSLKPFSLPPAPSNLLYRKENKINSIINRQLDTKTIISRKIFLNKTPSYTLLVNKRTKKLFVTKEIENGYAVIDEFPVSLGISPGNKQSRGDKKTPEGTYSLTDFKTDAELPEKYGPYATVINYPNKEDLKQGKTGSGIWIHGTGKNQLTPDTEGCVELSDQNMIKLYSYISKGTKIIITPENIDFTPEKNFVPKTRIRFAASS